MLVCAALKLLDYPPHAQSYHEDALILCGMGHADCIQLFRYMAPAPKRGRWIDGFITNERRFLSREEAKQHAIACGQISKDHEGLLFSEDLW